MSRLFDVREFGAVGDGKTDCTAAIQQAIDRCSEAGGGTVLAASGTYLFYPLRLKSGVRLEVAWDGVLRAGTDPARYPEIGENPYWKVAYALRNNRRYVFYGEGVEHVAICGEGKIDFQGKSFQHVDPVLREFRGHWKRKHDQLIPGRSIFFVGSRDIRLEGLTLLDSAGWFTWFLDCENVRVTHVTMHADLRMPNSDGIHFGSCRNAIVSDCDLHTGDDCIIVRAMQEQFDEPKVCENITVTNCILQSGTQAIRIGWTHDYIMRNCVFSNLVIRRSRSGIGVTSPAIRDFDQRDPPRYPDTPKPYPEVQPFAAENFQFSNIEAETIGPVFFIKLTDNESVDFVRNIALRGVHAVCGRYPFIDALPAHHVSDIEFSDVTLEMKAQPEIADAPANYGGAALELHKAKDVVFDHFRIRETL